ncbi:hypothetical protein [Methylorubrum extorquens]|uniref:Uncharacterized protein n=1 Tax=Methylorubrum extorquens DSM 13060 TaxID=882800 RepID=H1KCN2_METEX|nr:hypothetical protein [Methylorubrum extorquens]EHP94705.1 hypothetical protein MetexDRAFT_0394 [Methylorubrum extorquens DSM 13060]
MKTLRPILALAAVGGLQAAAFAAPTSAMPDGRFLERPATDPAVAAQWKDVLVDPEDTYAGSPPVAFVAEKTDAKGRRIVATVLLSGTSCNVNRCNMRILVDGRIKLDTMVCSNVTTLAMAPDGSWISACSERFAVPRR